MQKGLVVEHLSSKCKALSSNHSIAKNKTKFVQLQSALLLFNVTNLFSNHTITDYFTYAFFLEN
jgi:hypothetical protein